MSTIVTGYISLQYAQSGVGRSMAKMYLIIDNKAFNVPYK